MEDKKACKVLRRFSSTLKWATYERQESLPNIAECYINVETKQTESLQHVAYLMFESLLCIIMGIIASSKNCYIRIITVCIIISIMNINIKSIPKSHNFKLRVSNPRPISYLHTPWTFHTLPQTTSPNLFHTLWWVLKSCGAWPPP